MARPMGSKNKTTSLKITNPTSNEMDKSKIRAFVERIERLESEKAELTSDIASVYEEVVESEFDKKIVRACVRLRKKSKSEREADQEIIDLYMAALGDFASTDLGKAGVLSLHIPE